MFNSCSKNLGIFPKWQAGLYDMTKWKKLLDSAETEMVLNLQSDVDVNSFWREQFVLKTKKLSLTRFIMIYFRIVPTSNCFKHVLR